MSFAFFPCLCAFIHPYPVPHPHTHIHTFQHSFCVCLSVCVFPLSLHGDREFATVIKFHVSFTTCYNISIWFAFALFVSYLFSACAARAVVAVLSMPQKHKREMWKKLWKNIRSMQNSCQQNLYQPSELNAEFLFMQKEKRRKQKQNNWRDSFSVHAGRPVRPLIKYLPNLASAELNVAQMAKDLIGRLPNWLNDALN